MSLTIAQQITKSLKLSAAQSTNDPVKLRRSTRTHRPSARKLLSDASEAEADTEAGSRAPSRPPTRAPARSSTLSSRKPKEKSRKQLFGTRGARPGRITQPMVDLGTASNRCSSEPITAPEPHPDDTIMETQGGGLYQILHISREEAVLRATNFLNRDASGLSDESLNKVLDDMDALEEEGRASPMDAEGGEAPAQPRPTEQEVLGSGHQLPAKGVADDACSHDPQPAEEPALVEPPAKDLATEPEEEEEEIRLGPGDSVSQQPPLGPHTFQLPTPIPPPGLAQEPPTPPLRLPSNNLAPRQQAIRVVGAPNKKPNLNPIDESDEPTIPSSQRTLPPQFAIIRPRPTLLTIQPPLLRAARLIPPRSKPPPTSDVLSVLSWAADFAKLAAESRASSSQSTSASQGEFGLLAQVLGELQSNLAGSSLPLQPKVRLEAEAALVLGKHIRPRTKPVLSDFPGLPRHIASLTIPELIVTAMAEGAYETFGTNDEWTIRIFKKIAKHVAGDEEMIRRISCFRRETISKLRPVTSYRFGFINAPTTVQDLRHNINLAELLLPNSFHCRDPSRKKDPYENPDLREFIATVLFHNPDALGVVYHTMLNPMPIPTIAFFLTAMQHTIEEWKTGHRVAKELDAKVQLKMYESHYRGLLAYQEEAPGRFLDFQEDLFQYGMDYAGVSEDLHEPYQPITRASDIWPDSPTTRARAKGKARAT
ncbi:hypothetical protein RhiLY_12182 [Ceratobasidium sp. AG-Ba]|nr:hypothetical protein RhiLY_12182 [Ceratobasidium sp. AG-Ba]